MKPRKSKSNERVYSVEYYIPKDVWNTTSKFFAKDEADLGDRMAKLLPKAKILKILEVKVY